MDARSWLARLRRSATGARLGPIALELDAHRIELLQLQRRGQRVVVRALRSLAPEDGCAALLASPPALARTLRAMLASRPFRGRRIATVMPEDQVKLMVLNYRLEAGADEPELILRLVAERVEGGLDDCLVDYLPIRTSGEQQAERSALAAVARRDAVLERLELLRRAGLEVDALEIAPVAVRRLLAWRAGDHTSENLLALHAGQSRSEMIVLWGRRLILYREIDFGQQSALERLARTLDMAPESALDVLTRYGVSAAGDAAPVASAAPPAGEIAQAVREILKADFHRLAESMNNGLVYTASRTRGGSVDDVYLLGCLARWPGVDRLLEELVQRPVRVFDPLAGFVGKARGRAGESSLGVGFSPVVAGLALRGIADEG